MIIYYDTKTGNVEQFIRKVQKLTSWTCIKIAENMLLQECGHLITYTTKIGCVPDITRDFITKNSEQILSVTSSGNKNWGVHYAMAANVISDEFDIPLLFTFELAGLDRDVNEFILKVKNYANKKMDTPQQ